MQTIIGNIRWFGLFFILILPLMMNGQTEGDGDQESEWGKTFMPSIQMGYVAHGTEELSSGLITQTSIEYRDISRFVFRINYDDFNANLNIQYPLDSSVSFTGRSTFSELIIGVGYRQKIRNHYFTAYVQPGIRFYGYPVFEFNNNDVVLDYDSRRIGTIRYSIGYEYAISPRLFIVVEGLLGHTLRIRDFWMDNRWFYGGTIGISAPL